MMKRLFVFFALAACGDNKVLTDAPPNIGDDGGSDASRDPQAVVVAGDFKAGDPGVMSVVDETSLLTHQNVVAGAVGDDPILRRDGNKLYVVNRNDGNNVTVLDAATFMVLDQIATGANSNPQDVAVVGSKLYIPALGLPGVLVVDTTTNAMTTIDLSADDPKDGLPDCNSAFTVGTNVIVTCEILNNFAPEGNGKVHVIDSGTDTVTSSFALTTKNPLGYLQALPDGTLVIPTIDFSNGAGCVEQITTTGTPASGGCLINNTDMGNAPSGMIASGNSLLLVIPSADFKTAALRPFDLTAKTLGASITPVDQVVGDVNVCADGHLAVTDKGNTPGLRFYNGTTEVTTSPIDIGLKPQSTPSIACY